MRYINGIKRRIKLIIPYIQTAWLKLRFRNLQCEGLLYNCRIKMPEDAKIVIGKGCRLNNVKITITGHHNTFIVNANSKFIGAGRIFMEDDNGTIIIGKNLETSEIFIKKSEDNTSVKIGDNCLFSAKIVIRTSDGHSILDRATGRRINPGKDVVIDDHVWVGYGVTILKGSHIHHDSVIGSQSVVTGTEIPPHSVAAGMPAKVVKENIDWCYERI